MKSKFYANVELGGEITQVSFEATSAITARMKSILGRECQWGQN